MYIHTDIAGTAFIWTEVIVSCWIAGFMSAVRFKFTSRAGTIVLATCYKENNHYFRWFFFLEPLTSCTRHWHRVLEFLTMLPVAKPCKEKNIMDEHSFICTFQSINIHLSAFFTEVFHKNRISIIQIWWQLTYMKRYYAITFFSPDTEAKTAISTSKALIIVSVSFIVFSPPSPFICRSFVTRYM